MNDIPFLEVNNLKVVFDLPHNQQKLIIDDVDLLLNRGEILGIVGESGSGKTQTVYAILGIHVRHPGVVYGDIQIQFNPDEQSINLSKGPIEKSVWSKMKGQEYFYQKNVKRWQKEVNRLYGIHEIRGKRIFIMFQDPKSYLNPFWTIQTHFQRIVPKSAAEEKPINDIIIETLQRFKLPVEQVIHKYPHELSGGMNQRVMIALGYACKPDIIIADEITTGLDIINQVAVVKQLKEIQMDRHLSVILISHDIGFVSKLADKILVMYNGQGMEYGRKEDVFDLNKNRKHPYTRELLEIFFEKHKKGYIIGEPPGRDEIIEGCRFHTRCRNFLSNRSDLKCEKIPPDDFGNLREQTHQIRCKLFQS